MDWTCVYGQDVYLNGELLGYVGRTDEGIGILYLGKKEFCEIDENGKFWIGSTQIGCRRRSRLEERNQIQVAIGDMSIGESRERGLSPLFTIPNAYLVTCSRTNLYNYNVTLRAFQRNAKRVTR